MGRRRRRTPPRPPGITTTSLGFQWSAAFGTPPRERPEDHAQVLGQAREAHPRRLLEDAAFRVRRGGASCGPTPTRASRRLHSLTAPRPPRHRRPPLLRNPRGIPPSLRRKAGPRTATPAHSSSPGLVDPTVPSTATAFPSTPAWSSRTRPLSPTPSPSPNRSGPIIRG